MSTISSLTFSLLISSSLFYQGLAIAAPSRDFIPTDDSVVIEKLSPRISSRVTAVKISRAASADGLANGVAHGLQDTKNVRAAISAAKEWISLSKKTSDPRYLGRAQATLTPWWDDIKAPSEVAVLKATIQQSRHEFDAARSTLKRMLDMDPSNAQAWLTLATLERLSGNYDLALQACSNVKAQSASDQSTELFAAACRLETSSMMGQVDQARAGFALLIKSTGDEATQAWFYSLLAESEERAGLDAKALKAYRTSIALSADNYTALALSDLLLRGGKFSEAIAALDKLPLSDSVLLRRAYANKRLNNDSWKAMRDELSERFAALKARGDDERLHARELALAALWLEDNAVKALPVAQSNLELQKEPFDWWLVVAAAEKANQPLLLKQLLGSVKQSKLFDARLSKFESKVTLASRQFK